MMLAQDKGRIGIGAGRVRGRFHGVNVEWTRDRFAEVIRRDVQAKAARGWSQSRIWSWLKSAYALDQGSADLARKAFDEVIGPAPTPRDENGAH
ncbi:MAG TPA: hypothetical protein VIS07_01095 [Candidatus Binatia bacterium]